jgi:sporulation protein YlmC with PRC-barrel domain
MDAELIAGWVAPIATTIAACMTAANLGPRFTGWGFVVFSVGSIAWGLVGLASGQGNLLWQNAILTLINLIGIWRWLGREARYDAGARHAAATSGQAPAPSLFPARQSQGCPVVTPSGERVAQSVDAMIECGSGRISYLVLSEGGLGGVGERLHIVPWKRLRAVEEGFVMDMTVEEFRALPVIEHEAWPATRDAAQA